MNPEVQAWIQFSLVAVSSIFFIVDPIATIPAFLAMTADDSPAKRQRMAKQAAWTCFGVLGAFAMAGTLIFKVFGITMPALKIAGGLLLFLVAIEMLEARRSGTQEVEEERREGMEKDEIGIAPLGVPMLAGPGAISTAMVLMGLVLAAIAVQFVLNGLTDVGLVRPKS